MQLTNFYPYAFTLDHLAPGPYDQFLHGLIQKINAVGPTHQILLYHYEPQPTTQLIESIVQIKASCQTNNIVWYLSDQIVPVQQEITNIVNNVFFLEADLTNLYFELNIYKTSVLNQSWNPATGKFLFLTGKPDQSSRIGLLHRFFKKNLLDNCVWSLFMNDHMMENCRQYLPGLTDQEYQEFVVSHVRNPDDIKVVMGSGGSCHYDGYPFDAELYTNTSFRVIAETKMLDFTIITEKTWVTIANRQPFITIGYVHAQQPLKQRGFKTFEQYLPHPDYDSIVDEDLRHTAIVENVAYWVANIHHHQAEIAQDVEHNYILLNSLMNKTFEQFQQLHTLLDCPEYEIFRIMPTTMQRCNWINFYYGIKDPSWPDCFSERDFDFLPAKIQKECTQVHGYSKSELI